MKLTSSNALQVATAALLFMTTTGQPTPKDTMSGVVLPPLKQDSQTPLEQQQQQDIRPTLTLPMPNDPSSATQDLFAYQLLAPHFPGVRAIDLSTITEGLFIPEPTPFLFSEDTFPNAFIEDLVTATVSTAVSGDPADLFKVGVSSIFELFSMISGDLPPDDPMSTLRADLDKRLGEMSASLSQIQTTLDTVVGLETKILVGIQDTQLQTLLSMMESPANKSK